ncbi:MAG: FCD domain-containing protein, partial [Verrucomicrobiales bacterium]|nr:FCD domain-containing protein [Verrucomicrobiales bacterium]
QQGQRRKRTAKVEARLRCGSWRREREGCCCCRRADLSSITEIDLAMHRYWVNRASKELESVWLSITVRMLIAYTLLEDYMQCYQEHAAIVEAIIRRDLKAAKRAVNENIRYK